MIKGGNSMNYPKLFTSESVTEGHPDKVCDQISDAILDKFLIHDPYARVACETVISTNFVLVTGEISSNVNVDIKEIVKSTLKEIGYTRSEYGLDADNCEILIRIDEQSSDISQGVNQVITGAGDQGHMFGYASNETSELMPLSASLAHKLAHKLAEVRKNNTLDFLRPDGKVQVTIEYDLDAKPSRVDTIVVSAQHEPNVSSSQIQKSIKEHVIESVVPKIFIDDKTKYYINPTGRFVIGGPEGDTGLTGRKIIVDTYGGHGRHGGGAFSGKDATKVDRSASYAARYIAKNIVAAGLATECEVQLSYAIGMDKPVSIAIDTGDTGKIPEDEMIFLVMKYFDLTPDGIIKMLNLQQAIYRLTSVYGHFGNRYNVPWENTDKVEELKLEVANQHIAHS